MIGFECSNPECKALHKEDPRGHCPKCKKSDGSGYSCVPTKCLECGWCDNLMRVGAQFDRCDDCLVAIEYAMSSH